MPRTKPSESLSFFDDRPCDLLAYERNLWRHGYQAVAGVDEAGRGPLAGPVVAAAVVLDPEFDTTGINDSKILTDAARLKCYDHICKNARACAVALMHPEKIDQINILEATKLAMCRALERLSVKVDYVLIDGNQKIPILGPQRTIVGGDGKSASIAAASILAKVTRDRVMVAFHERWPVYRFDTNKGYPTKVHKSAVAAHGPCHIHRRTFSGVKEHC